jgi:DNA-binding transcriptional LysR family regulator
VYEAQALQREMTLIETGIGGSIGIGAGPAPAITVLPALLKHVLEQLPQLRVMVEINGWPILCEQLKKETIEFFLIDNRNVSLAKDLQITPLFSTQGGAAFCRPGHPLAKKRRLGLKQLGAFAIATTVLTASSDALYRELFQLQVTEPLPVKLTSDNIFLLLDIIAVTDAILITPRSTMRAALAAGTAIELPVEEFKNSARSIGEIVAVTPARRSLSPAAQYLIRYIQTHLSEDS